MPGLAQRNEQYSNAFWSKHNDDVSYNQLQKFWSELSLQARQELLRIDKQTLFERARKNIYCSRCNGLLLEGFLQIVMYGKSLQQEGVAGNLHHYRSGVAKNGTDGGLSVTNGTQDEIQDPSVHPWGGLTTTRDGSLTLLDCYLCPKSLKGLQKVFDSARARERERELLYPDACGGGGRGWISQGISSYGRGHGTRETCALHTARLSCDTLVDFWSALGEETRRSLLRMKEEDFIERLMYSQVKAVQLFIRAEARVKDLMKLMGSFPFYNKFKTEPCYLEVVRRYGNCIIDDAIPNMSDLFQSVLSDSHGRRATRVIWNLKSLNCWVVED